MPGPSETLPALGQRLADHLVAFVRLDEPSRPRAAVRNVRSWGKSRHAAEVALTVSYSQERTQAAPQQDPQFGI